MELARSQDRDRALNAELALEQPNRQLLRKDLVLLRADGAVGLQQWIRFGTTGWEAHEGHRRPRLGGQVGRLQIVEVRANQKDGTGEDQANDWENERNLNRICNAAQYNTWKTGLIDKPGHSFMP